MVDDAGPPGEQDVAALQQELDAARRETAQLREAVAIADARARDAAADAERLQGELTAATQRATEAEAATEGLLTERDAAQQQARAAAERYRELVVQQEPLLPPELITGETVDAVDASVASAREIAGRVRSHIDAQAQAARVPAGAPPRGAPDVSALTPEQKIRYGLQQRVQ